MSDPACIEVISIHVTPRRKGPPEPRPVLHLEAGRGLPGDHRDRPGIRRAVTLVNRETLDDVASRIGLPVASGASRRNVEVRGVLLDTLPPGTRLRCGSLELELVGPCDPCARMETALGPGAQRSMEGRGGVIARVRVAGALSVGSTFAVVRAGRPSAARRPRTPRGPSDAGTSAATPSAPVPLDPRQQQARDDLLRWYRGAHRDLPWRRTRDPYAIWLSEIMSQQTQVSTVIPYWERFLQRFPTVFDLAAAPAADVMALWSGLGYYARARNLHRCAQTVVSMHGGVFPADLEALLTLPGLGPYTAGAVGSIALGLDAPLVDGNVARVFCRIEGWSLGAEEARAQAWREALGWIPPGGAGDWNQALMELGATVCVPSSPKCPQCPVRASCRAATTPEPGRFPLPKVRAARQPLIRAVAALRDPGGRWWMARRASDGLFGGLWELPGMDLDPSADPLRLGPQALGGVLDRVAGRSVPLSCRGVVTATLTHRDVQVAVFETSATFDGPFAPEWGAAELRAFSGPELAAQGLSSLMARVLRQAGVPLEANVARRRAVRPASIQTLDLFGNGPTGRSGTSGD